ncbi:MAG TPA: thiamine pyrophosphate-dependent dehydrogenase E1 component subunit alpha [Candidatus Dormibacteraeota bacterium]|nr:thiamine pyrophosphate-dependent dehydrogenase E1 component subunit alpha [Candidatus Dormibacteraeota bacterium]
MPDAASETTLQPDLLGDVELLRRLYRQMVTIRRFEERVHALRQSGGLQGSAHLYVGQESVAVGVCARLRRDDYVASTHRGHGHAIAKGVDVARMMAELFGRETGTNRGKGGSMHIADANVGMLGATGVVGAGVPMALGAALSARTRGTDQVAVAFFGDGAMGQGLVYECLNMSRIWKLPLIFVCENNGYAESTPVEYALGSRDLARRVEGFGVPTVTVDGQDVFAVYDRMGQAVARARGGGGPSFLECKTYRYYGHFIGDDPRRYRTAEEEAYYRERDCIERFERTVVGRGALAEAELRAIDQEVERTIATAVSFAEESRPPALSELTTDVYTQG